MKFHLPDFLLRRFRRRPAVPSNFAPSDAPVRRPERNTVYWTGMTVGSMPIIFRMERKDDA